MPFLFCFSVGKNIKTAIEKITNTDDYGLIKVQFKLITGEKKHKKVKKEKKIVENFHN